MLSAYRILIFFFHPFLLILIYLRLILNKEDKIRFKEKIFSSAFNANKDNSKKLIWFHAASIGEVLSILPLIEEINSLNKNINFLITTVTLSSASLLKKKIDGHNYITHRFFPLDIKYLSEKFLNVWKPDLVCFVDSEIWPNFLFKIKVKKIPLVLINGRITEKTFRKWNIFPNFAKKVFANFDLCLACSKTSENILKEFQIKKLLYFGNLKFTAKIKKENLNKSDIKILDTYKVWCAASTHQGEEVFALKTHIEIKKKYKKILTVVVPRHINRVAHIQKLTTQFKLKSQILNENDMIEDNKEILIINSFGTLSKYFNYCKNVFVGKSLIKGLQHTGGQNPIEPAKFGCKVYFGPYVYNFQEVYDFLKNNKMAEQINNEHELSKKIIKNFEEQKGINHQNVSLLDSYGDKILQNTIIELNKLTRIKNENI